MKGILSRYIFAFDFCVEVCFEFALRISLAQMGLAECEDFHKMSIEI
jgi:hypothetical protein